jgi:spermidine dehydrogenase
MSDSYDRHLGMHRPITRRDFMNGMAVGVGGTVLGSRRIWAREQSGAAADYPPERVGLRGSHPGSFETAHAVRDGTFWKSAGTPVDTRETYDLVVVGGGISGLAAAHFYRERAGGSSRILILENHDDFGGHAKRNEFHLGGRLQLLNGGTLEIDSPTPYSNEADGLLKKLGIYPEQFQKELTDSTLYGSLGLRPAVFFNRETFGTDKLVAGLPGGDWGEHGKADSSSWAEFLAKTPLSEEVQADIARIEQAKIDYMPGLSSAQKKDRLSRISYRDFLLTIAKTNADVLPFYQTRTHGEWGAGIDAEPALDCWALGLPGFQGMGLERGAAPHMSYTAAGYANGGSYRFHFPDGNASIARLLVRDLIPQAVPGKTAEDVVTSRVDYGLLDQASSPVRIRLNSTAVRARNLEGASGARQVEVAYAQGREAFTVRARGCVLACWNMMIPYLCPELPEKQKEALHYLVKVPLVYTNVGIRNWTSFQKLRVDSISSPGCYHSSVRLNAAVNIGDYASPKTPEQPILLHLERAPCKPGLPVRDQHRAGRLELQTTSFETFERNTRDQLARTLSAGGFDPGRDIEAITVNRWPHGYGYEYNPLFDPDWPEWERPNVIGRKPLGRITIANSDSGATAYTDVAINQAFRAVKELE